MPLRPIEETRRHCRRTQLTIALVGIMLPLVALTTVEGFAIAAVPHAIASLNGFAVTPGPRLCFRSLPLFRCRYVNLGFFATLSSAVLDFEC